MTEEDLTFTVGTLSKTRTITFSLAEGNVITIQDRTKPDSPKRIFRYSDYEDYMEFTGYTQYVNITVVLND